MNGETFHSPGTFLMFIFFFIIHCRASSSIAAWAAVASPIISAFSAAWGWLQSCCPCGDSENKICIINCCPIKSPQTVTLGSPSYQPSQPASTIQPQPKPSPQPSFSNPQCQQASQQIAQPTPQPSPQHSVINILPKPEARPENQPPRQPLNRSNTM